MMSRVLILLIGLSALSFKSGPVAAQPAYASRQEQLEELARRRGDLGRAEARLATFEEKLAETETLLASCRIQLTATEAAAAERATVLYRLTRRGALVRYLLGSGSPIELLRRLAFLRTLSISALEERRQAGLRLAEAEGRRTSLIQSRAEAGQLIAELRDIVEELETELEAGHTATARSSSQPRPNAVHAQTHPTGLTF